MELVRNVIVENKDARVLGYVAKNGGDRQEESRDEEGFVRPSEGASEGRLVKNKTEGDGSRDDQEGEKVQQKNDEADGG